MRFEKDSLGTMEIPDNALYGIHSQRAVENLWKTFVIVDNYYTVDLSTVIHNLDLAALAEMWINFIQISIDKRLTPATTLGYMWKTKP